MFLHSQLGIWFRIRSRIFSIPSNNSHAFDKIILPLRLLPSHAQLSFCAFCPRCFFLFLSLMRSINSNFFHTFVALLYPLFSLLSTLFLPFIIFFLLKFEFSRKILKTKMLCRISTEHFQTQVVLQAGVQLNAIYPFALQWVAFGQYTGKTNRLQQTGRPRRRPQG